MKTKLLTISLLMLIFSNPGVSQNNSSNRQENPSKFNFDGDVKYKNHQLIGSSISFEQGVEGQALSIRSDSEFNYLELNNLPLNSDASFTVQFWIKTTSNRPTVLLSQKDFIDKSIQSQKNAGWVLYSSGGTFAWSVGSGNRRLNYERDNGHIMPLNDGLWHQLTMSYNKELSEIRLYYDGLNRAAYKVNFDFDNSNPLVLGCKSNEFNYEEEILPSIKSGAIQLQSLIDEFNKLDVEDVKEDEFISLIVDSKKLFNRKLESKESKTDESSETLAIFDNIKSIRRELSSNPYTAFQNNNLTSIKPINRLYSIRDGKVVTNSFYAKKFTEQERLYPSNFAMDNLSIWNRAISDKEVLIEYKKYREGEPFQLEDRCATLTVASWNIWHGGKHFTDLNNGWDSRLRVVEMIKKSNVDIILMQETYSSGDFIAAELGYYLATTSDWDYTYQGSNISVISRYPIKELEVASKTEFMNVAVKLTLSKTQEIYAMSNWYGMSSFPLVYDFHKSRFDKSDTVPILFGGDFNAIPNSDGGNNPASIKLLENGFTDAYRSLHPDIKTFPGYTHEWGERIDQLYYKGKGLENISTKVIHSTFGGFPSDHYMILSKFKLTY